MRHRCRLQSQPRVAQPAAAAAVVSSGLASTLPATHPPMLAALVAVQHHSATQYLIQSYNTAETPLEELT